MRGQYTLIFDYKSNERPWHGEHTNTLPLTEDQAKDWLLRFQKEMPDYYISLRRNWE